MLSSIKLKLTTWYVLVFMTIIAGLGVFLFYELKGIVISSIDNHLNSEVQIIASLIEVEGEDELEEELEEELSEASAGDYSVPDEGHYFQIISSKGVVLGRSRSLIAMKAFLPIADQNAEKFYQTIFWPEKNQIRLLNQRFRSSKGKFFVIQASESMEEGNQLLASFKGIILFIFPCAFILSAIGLWIIANYSFRNLKIFSQQIGQITERNLNQRLEETALDDELKPLAASFNAMLGRLESAFALQKEFLSNASHTLRTPLAVIKTYCEVTLCKSREQLEYEDALTNILDASNRISFTIDNIIEASRVNSDALSFKYAKIDLIKLIKDVVRIIKPNAARRGVTLTVTGDNAVIEGDKERLMEAFSNIIENGVKYNKMGGSVSIDVKQNNIETVTAVTDTGIGISKDEAEKIFNRFYRVKESSDTGSGFGLGLSIANSVISNSKGKIELESKKDEGSCFRIFLPNSKPE